LLSLSAFPEEFAEKTRFFWVIGMALATILFGDTFESGFDVLTTPRPAWFSAFTTSSSATHVLLFSISLLVS
jgi:hypothetical protein